MQGYVILMENVDYSKQLHGVDIAAQTTTNSRINNLIFNYSLRY